MRELIVLGALGCCAVLACLAPSTMPAVAMNPALPAVPRLLDAEGGATSSVALTPEWLLTVRHAGEVVAADGVAIVEMIPHPDPDVDLMLVRVEAPQPWPLAVLAETAPIFGEHLRALGHHHDEGLRITGGYQGDRPGSMSCPIIFGASGGPVLNDKNQVVGLVEELYFLRSPPFGTHIPITHVGVYRRVFEYHAWIQGTIYAPQDSAAEGR